VIDSGQCPCGRARVGCEYHDPALQPSVPSAGAPRKVNVIDATLDAMVQAAITEAIRLGMLDPALVAGVCTNRNPDGSISVMLPTKIHSVVVKGVVSI
jgi:hypothetical protein